MAIINSIKPPRTLDPKEVALFFEALAARHSYVTYAGDPTGNVTPRFFGETCFNTSKGLWYKAFGLTSADWSLTGESGTLSAATTVEPEQGYDFEFAVGVSTNYAREDHTHGTPADPVDSHLSDYNHSYLVTGGDAHDHSGGDGAAIVEAAITLADNTTNDVSITAHGFTPKAPNDTTKFLRGDAAWAVPSTIEITERGDPSASDFTDASLTTDGTWRDLDLSSIVPAGAVMVLLRVVVEDDAAESYLQFRKNGNSNSYAVNGVYTQVSGVLIEDSIPVFCDSSRVIEYRGSNLTFTSISIDVIGWYV